MHHNVLSFLELNDYHQHWNIGRLWSMKKGTVNIYSNFCTLWRISIIFPPN